MNCNLALDFERHATRRPQNLAISADGDRLTYGELARSAARLAGLLRQRSVRRLGIFVISLFIPVLSMVWDTAGRRDYARHSS